MITRFAPPFWKQFGTVMKRTEIERRALIRYGPSTVHTEACQRKNTLVIVPSYNEGAVLRRTVTRLLEEGWAVAVIDDGSSDDTPGIVDLPITISRHPVNMGQGAALQTGKTYALRCL
jgi:hypothetical protein